MGRFIKGEDRAQQTLFPGCLNDHVGEDNPARVVDACVDQLNLQDFDGVAPADTGRPGYHPATLLKIYLYGYLNRIQSSRRLEREAQRNVELMWLTGRLAPDTSSSMFIGRRNVWSAQSGHDARLARSAGSSVAKTKALSTPMLQRLEGAPDSINIRRRTVEHPFGTLKSWMGTTHFLTKGLSNVATEMSLNVLAYNLKRMMAIFGVKPLIEKLTA